MKAIYFIHGFYRSGLGLVSDAIDHCGGNLVEWPTAIDLSQDFKGVSVESKDLNELKSLIQNRTEIEIMFVKSPMSLDSWDVLQDLTEFSVYHIVVYRPLEQIVDSITRQRIQEIYLSKKVIGRIFSMRKFQKTLPSLQISIKKQFVEYYSAIMSHVIKEVDTISIVQSPDLIHSLSNCLKNIQGKKSSEFDIEKLSGYYDEEKFVLQQSIDKYRDEELMKIHSLFTANSST